MSTRGELIIVGDFNFHVEDFDNKSSKDFIETIDSYNLQQLVTGKTHTQGGTLDLVITSNKEYPQSVNILDDTLGSDHSPLLFKLKCSPTLNNRYITMTKRTYKNLDIESFKTDIVAAFRPTLYEDKDCQDTVNLYYQEMTHILDRHCPITTKTVRKRLNSPWYTEELHHIKRRKRCLERAWRKHKTTSNSEKYEHLKKEYNRIMTVTRNQYYEKKLEDSKTDIKSLCTRR